MVRHREARVVAADARLDVLAAVLHQLRHPRGVGEELARHAHRVDVARAHGGRAVLRRHAARAHHGDVHELFDVLDVLEVAVHRHVRGRVRPVPCVVGAVVAVEHVVARVLQELRGLFGFRHVAAHLDEVRLLGQRALTEALRLRDDRVAQRDGEVVAAVALDGLDDLGRDAVAVLKTAAVLVRALVRVLRGELVERVALVHGVHLDAVHARVLAHLCGLGERLHQLVDLLHGERAAHHAVRPAVRRGGRARKDVVHVEDGLAQRAEHLVLRHGHHQVVHGHRAAEARGDLDEQLRARLVEFLHVLFQLAELAGVLVQPAPAHRIADGGDARQDEAHVVLRALQKEVRGLLVKVVRLHPAEDGRAAHRAHHDAVLDLHIADLPRREECFVFLFHRSLLHDPAVTRPFSPTVSFMPSFT